MNLTYLYLGVLVGLAVGVMLTRQWARPYLNCQHHAPEGDTWPSAPRGTQHQNYTLDPSAVTHIKESHTHASPRRMIKCSACGKAWWL